MKKIILEKHPLGARIKNIQVTYENKEIRNEIETFLDANDNLILPNKYNYVIVESNFWGQVAKIIKTVK